MCATMLSVRIDFSEFHPLDHFPGDARCRSLPGGMARHFYLAWQYQWKETLGYWILWPFFTISCRFGWHRLHTWSWSNPRQFKTFCQYCDYSRKATPEEEFEPPPSPGVC
jgi:hypothetical protein